jgi:hypothetical protein
MSLIIAKNPQRCALSDSVKMDMSSWHKVQLVYQAEGNETCMTIGIFHNKSLDKEIRQQLKYNKLHNEKKLGEKMAYYYIDNVSLYPID